MTRSRLCLPLGLLFCLSVSLVAFAENDWLEQLAWREVGPTATGGRVTDIAVDPTNPHHILVASASGGLFETINNGTTWNCIFEKEGTLSIGDIAIDPQNPQTIWIGSGEANNQRSSLWGDGVYKSTDGGKTWKHLGLPESHHIGRIVIDPTDSNTAYVAALGHLYTSNPERGLYKTTDGGESWEQVLFVSPEVGIVDVVLDPRNPQTVYAASYERLRRAWNFDGAGPGSGIWKSVDGGANWKRLEGGLPTGEIGRIGIDVYAANPDIVYATVSNQNPGPVESSDEGDQPEDAEPDADQRKSSVFGIEVTVDDPKQLKPPIGIELEVTDDAIVASSVPRGSRAQQQGLRDGDRLVAAAGIDAGQVARIRRLFKSLKPGDTVQLKFQRNDETIDIQLTATDANTPRNSGRTIGGEIYRSEDGGESWTRVNESPIGGNPAYYYGQIRIDPQDDQRLYVLSVPVYVSDDGGKTFSADGAPSVHVDHHAFWINPDNPNHVMLGNDGGFHISYDRAKTWDYVFNLPLAQFYAVTADNQFPYHVYGGLQDNGSWGGPSASGGRGVSREEWYRVGGGDGFYVQVDPEDSNLIISESQFGAINRLNRATGESKSIRPPQPEGESHRYNWNSPILMSRYDSRVIYFGGNKLFKSFNRGDDWLTISPDLTTNDAEKIAGNVPHCTLTTIAESPFDRNTLMVGTDDGKVQKTTDGGESWQDLSNQFPYRPESWWCSRVEFSHADPNTAYASFTGYREDDFRPFLFKTTDGGQTWQSIAGDLPNEPINVIKQDPVNPATLYVGTEFSVFVSLDDGESWEVLDQRLPRVSVQDLLVHPRDQDLIIGTHGRGIYILDDIKPLQEFSKIPDDEPGFLFSVDDWTPLPRSFSGGFAGDRKRLAENPERGIPVWYHLAADADQVELVIRDEEGKTVADLEPEKSAGTHRARFTSVRQERGEGGGRGRGRFNRQNPLPPGEYTAVLKIGDREWTREFEIRNP